MYERYLEYKEAQRQNEKEQGKREKVKHFESQAKDRVVHNFFANISEKMHESICDSD